MNDTKTIWNKKYAETENLWGLKPTATLVKYKSLVPDHGKILDLGMGDGRNALYFASLGFDVEGVDYSENAIKRCRKLADEAGFSICANVADLREVCIDEESYSLIILSNVLSFFHDREIDQLLRKAKAGLVEDGLIYVQAFDLNDPIYISNKEKHEEVSPNTFYRPRTDSHMHFFTRNELEGHFVDYKTISISQNYAVDMWHGQPHFHGILEILMQKRLRGEE
ncbi:methyltransferase domain-containing protein [Rossellomorea aquimaris]|uniref:class I SAM-dependent methyltransferase n=1 Tax=Rossellomorea aquimaris TaxID=189382 RepID=UPI001CD52EF9|nr:class I SAM-dependent methyltransferase [Rossellomorea aquimaris]MCA1053991.1 methyltransferase domain-containing protein [Rossellomorea aquimaris]